MRQLKADGTLDCDECGMPLFPCARDDHRVRVECANRHHVVTRVPEDPGTLRIVDNWIAKRGAQLHAQHERWGTDDERGRDERDI
ncbi:MAG TPA: hypothetical protein VIN34_00610 [Candidatus Limnocylindria bacterium]